MLPIVFAQAHAGKTSENLVNVIWQIIYSFYREKQISKQIYTNVMKLVGIQIWPQYLLISKTIILFFPRSLVINPTDKMDLKGSDASVAISDLSVCYTRNNMKHLYGNKKN